MARILHKTLTLLWRLLLAAYLLALAVYLVGTFGLLGNRPDALDGLYLIPLGFPWFLAAELLPAALKPWAVAAAPIANILLVRWLAARAAVRA